ncbi:MAG TPA: hypothetical protein VMA36_18995 [Candidatus Limnocylindria bacterium]|nr:hypothetical protein [Candidatus Limnocylindria bacterium]
MTLARLRLMTWPWTRTLASPWVLGFAALAVVALLISAHGRETPYNNDVLLAQSMVKGHLWVDRHDTEIDSLTYLGHNWIIEGPVPALLLVPYVAVFGTANQTVEALLLCLVALAAAWRLLRRLGLSEPRTALLMAFLFAGTDLWWCSMLGDIWFVSHTAAVAFTFLALDEVFGKRRGWLVALWAALALGSRFSMILALPFYGALLAREAPQRRNRLIGFGAVVAVALALWVARDVAQYGTWRDLGYTLFFQQDPWGQPTGSPFRLSYLPYEVWSYFFQAPILVEYRQQALWPIFKVDPKGIALTFTSPALVMAFLAPRRRLTVLLWVTIALIAGPSFLYYLNGWVQFGMRHALDFEPFVLILMALGIRDRERVPAWGIALIAWSCLAGVWGVWYWDAFIRTGN